MQVFHTSVVEPAEIDQLGHMNVRFYATRAQAAAQSLMRGLGLDPDGAAGLLAQKDFYCRYHREQFDGATLVVRGGVLEAEPEGLRVYLELANEARGEIAASFIIAFALVEPATRRALPLPRPVLAAARAGLIPLPAHGAPRTIDLGPPRLDIAYEEAAARLADEIADPMSWHVTRTIEPESCDEHGFLSEREDMMFGGLRGAPKAGERWGPMTFTTDEGHRFGWASLETRTVRLEQPRLGETIVSLGAEIGLHAKVRHSRRWVFNQSTGKLVSLNDNVAIALDLDARKPIEIPRNVRSELDKRHVPELA